MLPNKIPLHIYREVRLPLNEFHIQSMGYEDHLASAQIDLAGFWAHVCTYVYIWLRSMYVLEWVYVDYVLMYSILITLLCERQIQGSIVPHETKSS